MIVVYLISLFDTFYCIIKTTQPYLTNTMRPIVMLILLSSSRAHFKSIFVLIRDSIIIILTLFAFVAFYAFCGYYIFKQSFEGYN